MGFMNKFFSSLGFESNEEDIKQSKKKEKKAKASYKLKKNKNVEKLDNIDGITVFYPEYIADCKQYVDVVKSGEALIINVDYAQEGDKEEIMAYCKGLMDALNGNVKAIEEKQFYILLPEGVEIEE